MGIIKKLSNNLIKLNDYYARSGQKVPINLDSGKLGKPIYEAMDYIEKQTGLKPGSKELNDRKYRNLLWKNLMTWTENNIESKMPVEQYGSIRDLVLNLKGDLGDIIYQRGATCRELSLFGHLFGSMYGLNTYVKGGEIDKGWHVWLETGGRSTAIDFNRFRSIFKAEDYPAKPPIREQMLVQRKNQDIQNIIQKF